MSDTDPSNEPQPTPDLLVEVYDELREIAGRLLRRERIGHSLQPTALVNELYLRLDPERRANWESRAHFFGAASQAIRRILVEHARRRSAAKRSTSGERFSLEAVDGESDQHVVDLLELEDALGALERTDPRLVQVVQLRYFGGLTMDEVARFTGRAKRTVENDWALARAWLRRRLEPGGAP